jgi:ribose 1,5-bisphosphokinase
VILHITASPDILRKRLLSRRRETPEMVEHRIQRSLAIEIPPECKLLEVQNNTTLHAAGIQLLHVLDDLVDWSQAFQVLKKG